MRLYISILAVAALSTTACSKKPVPAPEPAKTEPTKAEPTKEEPKTDPTAVKEEPKTDPTVVKEEPKAPAAADRTEGVQKALEAWGAGKYDETFANFTDDAVRHDVGDPMTPEIKGRQAIIDASKKMGEMLTDVKVKANRIIESGDTQVVEFTLMGNAKTKGADGAEVVKPVATRAAMILAYNADGKVTEMWHFMDGLTLAQQAGAVPGLPEGFVAPTLPETTEIVKGDANPALAATYKAFADKMKPDTIDQAVNDLIADDYVMWDPHSGKMLGKADLAPYMKQMFSMFDSSAGTMTVDKEISAGEYYVVVSTNTGTYKQGIPGATPDSKVTTHELAVAHIVDGKFKSWDGYMNGLEFASQIGLMGGAAAKPEDGVNAGGAGTVGVAECDLYIAKMTECMGKLPDQVKGTFESGMKTAVDSWKQSIAAGGDAAKSALPQACKTMLDTAKTAAGQMCPDVKWE